jgi:hypothetical protein
MAKNAGSAYFIFEGRDNVSKIAKGVRSSLGGLNKTASSVAGSMARNFAIATGATLALGGAIGFLIKQGASEQKEIALLNKALSARKLLTDKNVESINALLDANIKKNISDRETRAAVEVATRFTGKFSDALKITTVAADLAGATGMTLSEATATAGKAFAGNGKALKAYGIELNKGEKGISVLNRITRKFGGSAEAAADTVEGQFSIAILRLTRVTDDLGIALLPIATEILSAVNPMLEEFEEIIKANLPAMKKFVTDGIQKFKDALPSILSNLSKVKDEVVKFAGRAVELAQTLWGENGEGPLGAAVSGIATAFGTIADAIGDVIKEIDLLLKKTPEVENNPVMRALLGFGAGAAAGKATGIGAVPSGIFGAVAAATEGENPLLAIAAALALGTKGGRAVLKGGARSFLGATGSKAVGGAATKVRRKAGAKGIGKLLGLGGTTAVAGTAAAGAAGTAAAAAPTGLFGGARAAAAANRAPIGAALAKGGVKGVGGAAKAFGAQALKRVPIVGSLLAGGVTLAMGGSAQEAVGSAVGSGVGTAIGATLGSFIPIPVVGTLLGGAIGGFIGDSIGSAIGGLFSPQEANAASLASAAASLSSMTRPSIEVKVIHDQDAIDKIDVSLGKRWRDSGRLAF